MKKIINQLSLVLTMILLLATLFASAQTMQRTDKVIFSKNRVAIMPMIYIGDDNDERREEMGFQLQEIALNYMDRSAAELKFMDIAELNALLFKKGITDETIRQFTPREMAELLNVEYVIMGTVMQDRGSVVTVSNSQTTRRQHVDQYDRYGRHGRHENNVRVFSRNNHTGTSVTRQNVETQVSISIYNEDGEKIYTKSRQSILTEQDAYKNAIHYLLKRTPLYKR